MKDGEAEYYHNVSVKYVGGKKAVLTIYSTDGEEEEEQEREKVSLSDYNTKEEMHAMMVEKSFTKKTDEEIEAVKAAAAAKKAKDDAHRKKRRQLLAEDRQKRLEEAEMNGEDVANMKVYEKYTTNKKSYEHSTTKDDTAKEFNNGGYDEL